MSKFTIRPLNPLDRDQISQWMTEHWGADLAVVHDTSYKPSALPGFIAFDDDKWLGCITYHMDGDQCEIVTLDSFCPSIGVGTALLQAVNQAASEAKCRRLWLITTNDNLNALGFYQKRGFVLVAVHRQAVEKARKRKPEIPAIGAGGIPLRDEIELEMMLGSEARHEEFD